MPSPTPAPGAARSAGGLPGSREVIRRTLGRLFGPPPFDPGADPGDPGLTGPDSASWPVIAEPAAIAGGIRALLVQIAHPLAMAGVADHSAYRRDTLGRLQRTSAYVTGTTFGSTREALALTQRVRRAHPRVVGRAPDGRTYHAEDPELLAWVSVALTSSFLAAQRCWAPWHLEDEDAFVAEQSRLHALLDPRVDLAALLPDAAAATRLREGLLAPALIAEGRLPTTAAGLADRLESFSPQVRLDDAGRRAVAFLRDPGLPRPVRPVYRALFAGAVGSLEPWLAQALELDPSPDRARAGLRVAGLTLSGLRRLVGTSPALESAGRRAASMGTTAR